MYAEWCGDPACNYAFVETRCSVVYGIIIGVYWGAFESVGVRYDWMGRISGVAFCFGNIIIGDAVIYPDSCGKA